MALGAVALGLLPFSSCTCRETASEPPPKAAAPGGFGAMVTPRKKLDVPDRIVGQITPQVVEPQEAPTLPAKVEDASVPESFPEGIPIPEGSEVMAVQKLANDARNVVFSTEGEAPELFKLYKESMQENGWGNPTQEFQSKDQSFLTFKKGNTITNISVTKDPKSGRRVVAVMYYDEQPLPFPEF
jgi:hypothetical protein